MQDQFFPSQIDSLRNELQSAAEVLRLYSAVIENFPGGIVLTDENLNVVVCNEQQKQLLEYSPHLFLNRTPTLVELFQFNALRGEYGPGHPEVLVAEKLDLVKKRIPHVFERTRPDGRVIEVRGVPIQGGGFVTTYNDITERRRSEELIAKLAFGDSLTGLANRAALQRDFIQFAARAKRGEHFALHYIDLNGFKPINDHYGHSAGDAVLTEVALRLKSIVRETDIVARYGGDEFIILQSNVTSAQNIKCFAERVLIALNSPFTVLDAEVTISGSIGISSSLFSSQLVEFNNMINSADAEMYRSKNFGHGIYGIFNCAHKDVCNQLSNCNCNDGSSNAITLAGLLST